MNYVIVGACAAGLAAAEAVRKADAKGNITMLQRRLISLIHALLSAIFLRVRLRRAIWLFVSRLFIKQII